MSAEYVPQTPASHWKAGGLYAEAILAVKDAEGIVRPRALTNAARDPNHPMHHLYDWNDATAAEEARDERSRLYIRRVQFEIVRGDAKPVTVRALVSLVADRKHGDSYRLMADVINDETRYRWLVAQCLAELKSAQRKYATIAEFAGVSEAIDEMRKRVSGATNDASGNGRKPKSASRAKASRGSGAKHVSLQPV